MNCSSATDSEGRLQHAGSHKARQATTVSRQNPWATLPEWATSVMHLTTVRREHGLWWQARPVAPAHPGGIWQVALVWVHHDRDLPAPPAHPRRAQLAAAQLHRPGSTLHQPAGWWQLQCRPSTSSRRTALHPPATAPRHCTLLWVECISACLLCQHRIISASA